MASSTDPENAVEAARDSPGSPHSHSATRVLNHNAILVSLRSHQESASKSSRTLSPASLLVGQLASAESSPTRSPHPKLSPYSGASARRCWSQSSLGGASGSMDSEGIWSSPGSSTKSPSSSRKPITYTSTAIAKAKGRSAQKINDSMVYLDGPQIYTCAHCRTHLTSHDDIISKAFHGKHGRAYLFDKCVNVTVGPPEDRLLITGLHSVNDICCKRCKNMLGWTYSKAYESSQKYKEGKFIIEKIFLHMEESEYYDIAAPAGERQDRWRRRSMSWGSDAGGDLVYEYQPSSPRMRSGDPSSPSGRRLPRTSSRSDPPSPPFL